MKKEEFQYSRKTLVLLFSGIVFIILFVLILIVGGIAILMIRTGFTARISANARGGLVIVAIIALISLVLGAGISFAVSQLLTSPVNRLIHGMNELASGNYKVRLSFGNPIARHPAFKDISNSFNAMANELDRTEILRADFINNFSHEFKTPIVSIAGFAKLLRKGRLTDKQKEEYAAIIEEESLRLSALTTNVLNLTRIENQTILTNVTRYNLSEQIRNCILLLEEKWTKKNIQMNPDFDEYETDANEELLKQVWINLLDNAVKFAQPGGEVSVTIEDTDTEQRVSVTNTGSSIRPEDQRRIFNKFYQADESHASEGNGIGLAIVKGILNLHSGKVDVFAEEDRTVFTVVLPKRKA